MLRSIGQEGIAALPALGRELRAWQGTRKRARMNAQAVLSVAFAVLLARALHLEYAWWAGISGFAIVQDSLRRCVERCVHRLLGTFVGAALGLLAGPLAGDRPWLFVAVLGAIAGGTVLRANDSKSSYAWVLGGVTAMMVIDEARALISANALFSFALSRLAEVAVGTLACVFVAVVFQWVAGHGGRSDSSTADGDPAHSTSLQADIRSSTLALRLRLGACAGIATVIIAMVSAVMHLPAFAQAMVTTVALLILPSDALANGTRAAIRERMVQRLTRCLLAGLIGVGLLPLTNGAALPSMLALSFGVWLGCHVQTGTEGASYVGRQFAVAFIMVFVEDHRWSADPHAALLRWYGILTGVIVLAIVIAAIRSLPFSGRVRRDRRT